MVMVVNPPSPDMVAEPVRRPSWLARLFGRDRRRGVRQPATGLTVVLNGQNLPLADIGATGMCIIGYRGLLAPQDRFGFRLMMDGLRVEGEAIVAWRRGDRMGAAFYALTPEARLLLSRFAA